MVSGRRLTGGSHDAFAQERERLSIVLAECRLAVASPAVAQTRAGRRATPRHRSCPQPVDPEAGREAGQARQPPRSAESRNLRLPPARHLPTAKPKQVAAKPRAKSPTVKCNVPNSAGKPYYVEFRARTAVSFGHAFVVYGKANSAGGAATWEIAGLHPAGNDPNVYAVGLVVPVPSETGMSDGDLDEEYVSARWCVRLSEPDYRKMVAFIKDLKERSPRWHGPTTNCTSFIGDIARSIGLEAPAGLLYPEVYVNSIKSMNTGGSQLPNIPTVQWSTQPAAAIGPGRSDNP